MDLERVLDLENIWRLITTHTQAMYLTHKWESHAFHGQRPFWQVDTRVYIHPPCYLNHTLEINVEGEK